MATLQTKFVAVLKCLGYAQIAHRSTKSIVLEKPGQQGTLFFVGRAGGVRKGPTKSSARPISERSKGVLLQIWSELEEAEAVTSTGVIDKEKAERCIVTRGQRKQSAQAAQ
jgi:hypothetical protein